MRKNKFKSDPFKFIVVPTELRNASEGEFVAQLTEKDLKKYNLKAGLSEVVISHKLKGCNSSFKTVVKIQKYPEKTGNNKQLDLEKIPFEIKNSYIAIDQTIRDAIGCATVIDKGKNKEDYIVEVYFPEASESKFSASIKKLLLKTGNAFYINQYNIARVLKATPNDMEINISRISFETMQSIGVEDGDKIKVRSVTIDESKEFYITRQTSIRALMMDANRKEKREKLISSSLTHKSEDIMKEISYQSLEKLIKLIKIKSNSERLPMIFLDNDAREKLGVEVGDTVIICRSFRFAILNNIMKITIPLLLVFLGVILNLKDFLNLEETTPTIILSIFFLITVIIILLNLLPILRKFK